MGVDVRPPTKPPTPLRIPLNRAVQNLSPRLNYCWTQEITKGQKPPSRHPPLRRLVDGQTEEHIRYVIARCDLAFEEQPSTSDAGVLDPRLVCLGDDPDGQPIEVIVVEGSKDEPIVIHAMALRTKYTDLYEEAKRWRL